MNLLQKVKRSLGLGSKSTGNVLGSGSTPTPTPNPSPSGSGSPYVFNGIFHEHSLGLTIESAPNDHPYSGAPICIAITKNSDAERNGIEIGDVITGIQIDRQVQSEIQTHVITYGDFASIIQAIERPVTLTFARVPYNPSKPKDRSNKVLSNEEKNEQREARVNAALNREKAWEKRVSSAATTRRKKEGGGDKEESDSVEQPLAEEVQRSIEIAKQNELQTIQAMGYNPFRPHISTNNNPIISNPPSPSFPPPLPLSPQTSSKSTYISTAGIPEENLLLIESALQTLTTRQNGESSENIRSRQICCETAMKMLSNIRKNPSEPKFRCIRLSNASFRTKIAEVEGGLELMLGAGFVLSEESSSSEKVREGATSGSGTETFLRHYGATTQGGVTDDRGQLDERQLDYTYFRYSDLPHLLLPLAV